MRALVVFLASAFLACSVFASGASFSGEWEIDLRTASEKSAGAECGTAGFMLAQVGNKISGDHWMATAGCGRVNEGGEGSVVGTVRDGRAILTVTSRRNGEIVRGRATLEGTNLRWKVLEELKPGEPEGDSGLILYQGLLRRK